MITKKISLSTSTPSATINYFNPNLVSYRWMMYDGMFILHHMFNVNCGVYYNSTSGFVDPVSSFNKLAWVKIPLSVCNLSSFPNCNLR